LPSTPVPEIEEFETKFGLRQRLWTIRHDFGNDNKRWYRENFRDQDALKIVETVKANESELVKIKAKMGRDTKDEVLEAATTEVKNVSRHKDLIQALGNKAMLEKHWQKVWALVDGTPSIR